MKNGYNSGSQIIFENENLYTANLSYNQDVEFVVNYEEEEDSVSEVINTYSLSLSVKTNSISDEEAYKAENLESSKNRENRIRVKFEDMDENFDPVEDCACFLHESVQKEQCLSFSADKSDDFAEFKPIQKSYGFLQRKLASLFD
ncbi:MAG: hypothetical protein N4A49_04370 [Marinifilaceae bacterium]|jgi:hypothetical protein|nr:hypothetical protein [Marinifilaceae bacterium]